MTIRSMMAAAGLMLVAGQAQAAVFKPTAATASSIASSPYAAVNTINGTGLTGDGTDINEAHAAYSGSSGGNHWTSNSSNPIVQWIDWTFAAPVTMGAAYIWNHQSTTPLANNTGYDVTLFDLILFDASDNVLLFLDNRTLAPDNAFAQRIDFGLTSDVSRVRFDIEAVQSSTNFTGLAEVAFDTESYVTPAIPEPASWLMLIAGFGMTGAAMRRRAARPAIVAA